MQRTYTTMEHSVVSELQMPLRNVLALHGTFPEHIQTAYQRTAPESSLKARNVQAYRTVPIRTRIVLPCLVMMLK